MRFINSIKNMFTVKVNSLISKEDLSLSRYISIYNYHSKRNFREFLEETTIDRVNMLMKELYPSRISMETKKKILDCIVIFLKFISIHYDYWPGDHKYDIEFNRIIKLNVIKLLN